MAYSLPFSSFCIRILRSKFPWPRSWSSTTLKSLPDESRHLERERHPRARRAVRAVGRGGAARRRLPAGDQGEDRAGPGRDLQPQRLLVLLAWTRRLLRRGPAPPPRHVRRGAGVLAPGLRSRDT